MLSVISPYHFYDLRSLTIIFKFVKINILKQQLSQTMNDVTGLRLL
jgi:hypothetical protein